MLLEVLGHPESLVLATMQAFVSGPRSEAIRALLLPSDDSTGLLRICDY